ncbi:MAG: stage II sporulation protein P [Ruminococcus sp.]|nr:stage II sporulation protein P [Ruminococcus sp.]
MKHHKCRKIKGLLKTVIAIAVPSAAAYISGREDILKNIRNEFTSVGTVESTEASPNIREHIKDITSPEDMLCGSLILSEGYGIKPEIEQGEHFLELQPPLEMVSDTVGEVPYPNEWSGGGQIIRTTFGEYIGDSFFSLENGGQVNNKTDIPNEVLKNECWYLPNFSIDSLDEPLVLIYHTHTCESFEPFVRDEFDVNFNFRTTDETKNMVMVGNAIQAELEAQGIGVIHSTEIHDHPSYSGAYDRSRATIMPILEEYPSIRVVLDIHRDALGDDSCAYQPFIRVDGKEAAQVMIISCCDDGTMGMPNYMENFHFACNLQQKLETDFPGITRPILFDYRCYNQDLTNGSLLIEVGSHGNTLEQSQYSGQLIGKSLGELLKTMCKE